jgi:hypothetical protein
MNLEFGWVKYTVAAPKKPGELYLAKLTDHPIRASAPSAAEALSLCFQALAAKLSNPSLGEMEERSL